MSKKNLKMISLKILILLRKKKLILVFQSRFRGFNLRWKMIMATRNQSLVFSCSHFQIKILTKKLKLRRKLLKIIPTQLKKLKKMVMILIQEKKIIQLIKKCKKNLKNSLKDLLNNELRNKNCKSYLIFIWLYFI